MVNVEEHLKLAEKIAWRRYGQFKARYEFDEIYQVACLGLVEAAKNFDEKKGYAFSTFAYGSIDYKILNFVRGDAWYLGHNKTRLDNAPPASLDAELLEEGSGVNLHSIIGFPRDEYEKILTDIDLKNAFKYLSEKQRIIIEQAYFKGLTKRAVAKNLGISLQMINYEEKKMFKILRRKLA